MCAIRIFALVLGLPLLLLGYYAFLPLCIPALLLLLVAVLPLRLKRERVRVPRRRRSSRFVVPPVRRSPR